MNSRIYLVNVFHGIHFSLNGIFHRIDNTCKGYDQFDDFICDGGTHFYFFRSKHFPRRQNCNSGYFLSVSFKNNSSHFSEYHHFKNFKQFWKQHLIKFIVVLMHRKKARIFCSNLLWGVVPRHGSRCVHTKHVFLICEKLQREDS